MDRTEAVTCIVFIVLLVSSAVLLTVDDHSEAKTIIENDEDDGNYCKTGGLTWYFTTNGSDANLIGWGGRMFQFMSCTYLAKFGRMIINHRNIK